MKIKREFILRKVGEDSVAVPTGDYAADFNGMIKLNDTAANLWRFFSSEHTEEEGVEFLLREYDVNHGTAEKNVKSFIANLMKNGFAE